MKETNIMQKIRLECADIAVLFRNNVGKLEDKQGRWVTFGLHIGSGDLIGWRRGDGIFVSIEVKQIGKTATPEQINFAKAVRAAGGLAGVVSSVEEARHVIKGG